MKHLKSYRIFEDATNDINVIRDLFADAIADKSDIYEDSNIEDADGSYSIYFGNYTKPGTVCVDIFLRGIYKDDMDRVDRESDPRTKEFIYDIFKFNKLVKDHLNMDHNYGTDDPTFEVMNKDPESYDELIDHWRYIDYLRIVFYR